MANLSSAVYLPTRGDMELTSIASQVSGVVYQGQTMLFPDGSFAGFAANTVTGVASGDEIAVFGGVVGIAGTNILAGDAGKLAYVDISAGSNNPADIIVSGAATGDVPVGQVQAVIDGFAWVDTETRGSLAAHA